MANTYDIQKMTHMGDMRMTITLITGDNSTTEILNTDIGLSKIQFAWLQDVDDGVALGIAVTTASITLTAAIGNGEYQWLFAIGW